MKSKIEPRLIRDLLIWDVFYFLDENIFTKYVTEHSGFNDADGLKEGDSATFVLIDRLTPSEEPLEDGVTLAFILFPAGWQHCEDSWPRAGLITINADDIPVCTIMPLESGGRKAMIDDLRQKLMYKALEYPNHPLSNVAIELAAFYLDYNEPPLGIADHFIHHQSMMIQHDVQQRIIDAFEGMLEELDKKILELEEAGELEMDEDGDDDGPEHDDRMD